MLLAANAKPRSIRIRVLACVAIIMIAVYVVSFYSLRQTVFITYWIRNTSILPGDLFVCTRRVYFFSRSDLANRICFCVFWPIHRLILQGNSEKALHSAPANCNECGQIFYVEHLEALFADDR